MNGQAAENHKCWDLPQRTVKKIFLHFQFITLALSFATDLCQICLTGGDDTSHMHVSFTLVMGAARATTLIKGLIKRIE